MVEGIIVEPMREKFILWRCLHGGLLSCDTIGRWSSADNMPWDLYRKRNIPLLKKITRTLQTAIILPWQSLDRIEARKTVK
jgi:hypothetical protein